MSLNTLANKTLKHTVTRQDGAGEEVIYTRATDRNKTTINSLPQKIVDGELSKDRDKSFVTFHALFLDIPPNRGDVIEWNNEKYHYEKTLSQTENGSYDVLAFMKNHTLGNHRR